MIICSQRPSLRTESIEADKDGYRELGALLAGGTIEHKKRVENLSYGLSTFNWPTRGIGTMAVNIEIIRSLVKATEQLCTVGIGVDDLPGDWRVWFEERAALMEYEGGLPRERAETLALKETVQQMRAANETLCPIEINS